MGGKIATRFSRGMDMTSSIASRGDAQYLDSGYAWWRLAVAVALSTVGGIGLWSVIVALPTIEAEFGVDRGGATLPYTATLIGFAIGGVFMGRVADRFGVSVPVIFGGISTTR